MHIHIYKHIFPSGGAREGEGRQGRAARGGEPGDFAEVTKKLNSEKH